MEVKERLLEEITLANGLTVSFYDGSKPVAGDRCQAQLLIVIPLQIDPSWLENDEASIQDFPDFLSGSGGSIVYRQTKVRNFIDNRALATTLDKMKEEFLAANTVYLSNPSFPKKYTMSRFHDWKRESTWAKLHNEAVLKAERGCGEAED